MARRVLIVEDDADIGGLLELHLKDLHCEAKLVRDGAAGLKEAQSGRYDLVILDLMLPGPDGLEICRRVRAETGAGAYTPILMLTSRSSELERVLGLEMGADDYLTKPFSVVELLARVKAIFRRVDALKSGAEPRREIRAAELTIDPEKRKVTLGGENVELTAKEFDLLLYFARNPGRVYTRGQLLDQVWGYQHSGYEHTVNSHINRLRAKIERDVANPRFVQTVRGVGYKFNESLGDAG